MKANGTSAAVDAGKLYPNDRVDGVSWRPRPRDTRRQLAAERVPIARRALSSCAFCAHRCGVDRTRGPAGVCHAGDATRVFSVQVEVSDELEIIPTFAIALGGCDLRCAFCVTGAHSWNAQGGQPLDVQELAERAAAALERDARTVMILGGEPTIHLPAVLEIVSALPESARLVFKTNAYGSFETQALLAGLFDVWLPDYKFGNDACAERLARVPRYTEVVRGNIRWAAGQGDAIVRHLIMPGHLDCCWRPVAEWLAAELPGIKVNLRAGFWPGWQVARHQELCRPVSNTEAERAFSIARELKLNLVE